MRNNKKGFTLVELVIVIAVIAILASVLLPTFANVIEEAKESSRVQSVTTATKELLSANAPDTIDFEGYIFVIDNNVYTIENGQIVNANESYDITELESSGTPAENTQYISNPSITIYEPYEEEATPTYTLDYEAGIKLYDNNGYYWQTDSELISWEDAVADGYIYLNDKGDTILGFDHTCMLWGVYIPYSIKSVADNAFENAEYLVQVAFPKITFGKDVFKNTDRLYHVIYANGWDIVDSSMFASSPCVDVHIPSTATDVVDFAFNAGCVDMDIFIDSQIIATNFTATDYVKKFGRNPVLNFRDTLTVNQAIVNEFGLDEAGSYTSEFGSFNGTTVYVDSTYVCLDAVNGSVTDSYPDILLNDTFKIEYLGDNKYKFYYVTITGTGSLVSVTKDGEPFDINEEITFTDYVYPEFVFTFSGS